jgi:hypothetical protein
MLAVAPPGQPVRSPPVVRDAGSWTGATWLCWDGRCVWFSTADLRATSGVPRPAPSINGCIKALPKTS